MISSRQSNGFARRSSHGRLLAVTTLLFMVAAPASAASLKGSKASIRNQKLMAAQHDFTILRNSSHVRKFVGAGILVPISNGPNHLLDGVSYPYARTEMKTFISRLAADYRDACGESLVITSLTRPVSAQPRNASPDSVHPTGMAVDIRRSRKGSCQRWLDASLLRLERAGVLDATKENRPPHYHVALFPKPYKQLVAAGSLSAGSKTHEVRKGDTLWDIARRFGTSVAAIRRVNGLSGSGIRPGQVLRLP